jgi:hypothetical protein
MLLSLVPILMQTILAQNYFEFFLTDLFLFYANKRIRFCFKDFFIFTYTLKGRGLNLCQLFTCARSMLILVEPNHFD